MYPVKKNGLHIQIGVRRPIRRAHSFDGDALGAQAPTTRPPRSQFASRVTGVQQPRHPPGYAPQRGGGNPSPLVCVPPASCKKNADLACQAAKGILLRAVGGRGVGPWVGVVARSRTPRRASSRPPAHSPLAGAARERAFSAATPPLRLDRPPGSRAGVAASPLVRTPRGWGGCGVVPTLFPALGGGVLEVGFGRAPNGIARMLRCLPHKPPTLAQRAPLASRHHPPRPPPTRRPERTLSAAGTPTTVATHTRVPPRRSAHQDSRAHFPAPSRCHHSHLSHAPRPRLSDAAPRPRVKPHPRTHS